MFRADRFSHPLADKSRIPPYIDEAASAMTTLSTILPKRGDVVLLDDVVDVLSCDGADSYAIVAALVRACFVVVEFEAIPRPFPFRDLLVRRL